MAESSYRRRQHEIDRLRSERGMSDDEIVAFFAETFTGEQLLDMHADAVRKDRTHLTSAIQKALLPTARATLLPGTPSKQDIFS